MLNQRENKNNSIKNHKNKAIESLGNSIEQRAGPECVIPQWLLSGSDLAAAGRPRGRGTGFIRRTVKSVASIFQTELLAEKYAAEKGLLQGLNPGIRLVSILILMLFAGLVKGTVTLMLLAMLGYMLARLSRLPSGAYIKRVWLFIPLITLLVSIPAATSLFIPGKPVYQSWQSNTGNEAMAVIYLTDNGIKAVIKMTLRIGVSISFGYILIMTTRWRQLTSALRRLRIPGLLVAVLDMTYRYIFVLAETVLDMFDARFARTVGRVKARENRKFVSGGIALLFIKSSLMSDEVYNAMCCRGYTGETAAVTPTARLTRNDLVWGINFVMIIFVLILEELIFGS